MPLVSVIVPVRDLEGHVGACIVSLKRQVLTGFEVLVVDDGSTDGTAGVVERAIDGDGRFRLIRQGHRGLGAARNTGLDQARGTFIAFVDGDDRVAPDFLSRLHAELEAQGGDWIACGLAYCHPDGTGEAHSARHDAPGPPAAGASRRLRFRTWSDAVQPFPSAWNKLYRASFLDDLRFDEGTWFEDHSFYLRLAARAGGLLYLPQPLYLQSQGRAGQITASDDDRVFDQFGVLDRMREVMAGGDLPGAEPAFATLARRLTAERAVQLCDPARRRRFVAATVAFFRRHGIDLAGEGQSAAWALELSGETVLSIVVPWDGRDETALAGSLASIAAPATPGHEVVVVCDDAATAARAGRLAGTARVVVQNGQGAGPARNHGLSLAAGRLVSFLDAGDTFVRNGARDWCETMLDHDADFGFSQFGLGPGGTVHNGFHDQRPLQGRRLATGLFAFDPTLALALHAQVSAKIFRRGFLDQHRFGFAASAWSGWAMTLAAALTARRAVHIGWPGVTICMANQVRAPLSARVLAGSHDALVAALPEPVGTRLPEGWRRRLFARALWDQVMSGQYPSRVARLRMFAGAARAASLRGLATGNGARAGLDPFIGPRFIRAMAGTRAAIATALTGCRGAKGDVTPLASQAHALTFPLSGPGRFRFRAGFGDHAYANVAFYAADKTGIPFHLSLRRDTGVAVVNTRAATGRWGREVARPVTLPVTGAEVEVHFNLPVITVSVEGHEVFRLGAGFLHSRGVAAMARNIAFVDRQGGVAPLQVAPALPGSAPALDPRLTVLAPGDADALCLRTAHEGATVALIPFDRRGGVQALLPGQVWDGLDDAAPLVLELRPVAGGQPVARLTLTRADMAARIAALLALEPFAADAELILTMHAHVRHGGLAPYLPVHLHARLDALAATCLGLPAVQPDPPDPALDRLHAALARFGDGLRQDPAPDPLDLLRSLPVETTTRDRLFLALGEYFCAEGRDFPGFYAAARGLGLEPVRPDGDDWLDSARLPFLALEGRTVEALEVLTRLAERGTADLSTPPVAWLARWAAAGGGEDAGQRAALLRGVVALVDPGEGPRDHGACAELTGAGLAMLLAVRTDPALRDDIAAFCLRVFGLSPRFWDMAAGMTLPPMLETARAAFADAVAGAGQGADAPARRAARTALSFFATHDNVDVPRWRRALFGPSGIAADPLADPDPAELTAEATFRHLAFPGVTSSPDLAARAATGHPPVAPETAHSADPDLQVTLSGEIERVLAGHAPPRVVLARLGPLCSAGEGWLGLALAALLTRDHPEAGRWLTARLDSLAPADRDDALAAPALRMAMRTPPADGEHSLLYDTIVTVISCQPNLTSHLPPMRAGWLSLLGAMGIPHVVVVGGGGGGRQDGDVLHLDVPDDYGGLPLKVLETVRWVRDRTPYAHMLKIDDDCVLSPDRFFRTLSYRKHAYYGRRLDRDPGQTDRLWHLSKGANSGPDLSPEPSAYADGSTGYSLNRDAMEALIAAADSPQGQRLIAGSRLEDKLVGDLLAMRGIVPRDEDFAAIIRRRSRPGGRPVGQWRAGFAASEITPTMVEHLDRPADQVAAMERLGAPVLRPSRLWPGDSSAMLGHNGNGLEFVSPADRLDRARNAAVAVVAAVRNERAMIPHFLNHYRRLGVEAFLIADNLSDDGTLEMLAEEPDVALFSADTDYRVAGYGTDWQQALLGAFRQDRWSVLADADELLVWRRDRGGSLPDLVAGKEFADADAARVFLLDLYPKGALEAADIAAADPFEVAGFADRTPFLANIFSGGPFSGAPGWSSALRHRLIPQARPSLFAAQKWALLRYRPWMRLAPGLHFVAHTRPARRELIFGHFKYHAGFAAKAQAEAARGQHFNGAEEYRAYFAAVRSGRTELFDPDLSVRWYDSPFVAARLDG